MKRFRVKVAAWEVAFAAGTALALCAFAWEAASAADSAWHAPGEPPPPPVVVPAGAPGLLPSAMRGAPSAAKNDPEPLWLPSPRPDTTPHVMPVGGVSQPAPLVLPAPQPVAQPAPQPVAQPIPQPVSQPQAEPMASPGPRIAGGGAFGPLPEIPVPQEQGDPQSEVPVVLPDYPQPSPTPQPPTPQPSPTTPKAEQPAPAPKADQPPATPPAPLPIPRPADSTPPKPPEPPMMIPPRVPDSLPPVWKGDPRPLPDAQPLPYPKPVETPPQTQPELPTAPPELLYPAGYVANGQRGSFSSLPIRLSADYPPMRDLVKRGFVTDGITLTPDGADGSGGPMNRYFVTGEYLLWWVPGFGTPILATSNANTALNGYLSEPGTTAIIGPGAMINGSRSGVRIRGGAWLDDCGSCGIDASFFILGNRSATSVVNSNTFPLITRPVFVPNLIPGTNTPLGENGEAVAVPGVLRGSVTAKATSQLLGADANFRKSLCNTCDTRAEIFAGYRFLNLREGLGITEDITVIGTSRRINTTDPIGTHVIVHDQFTTTNYFNGGQIGARYERQFGRWYVNARGSVALGDTHQILEISGYQIHQAPGMAPTTFNGGLLAAGPNLGQFTKDRFSVVPELTLNLGYRVTDNIRVFAGYNLLLWTNVIRPGDQIDHVVDLTFVPNALPAGFSGQYRPHPLFKQTDLVVNGIQFGLDLRW